MSTKQPATESELKVLLADLKAIAASPVRWVDPIVTLLISDWPSDCWPVVLYADNGTRPVEFKSPAELIGATQAELSEPQQITYLGGYLYDGETFTPRTTANVYSSRFA